MRGGTDALVGITFSQGADYGILELDREDKFCWFIGEARRRGAFWVAADAVSCPLARYNLSIGETDVPDLARTLVGWGDAADQDTALDFLRSTSRLEKSFTKIIFASPPKDELEPDVLVWIGTADEGYKMVKGHVSQTGRRVVSPMAGIGAACGTCTAGVVREGSPAVSLGCGGSRPAIGLEEGELLIGAPADSLLGRMLRVIGK